MEAPSRIREAQDQVISFLNENPEKAIGPDKPVTASMEAGLRCKIKGEGIELMMDMSKEVGGGASAPSPGMYLRAADAGCLAIVIAMKAARENIVLRHLEVTVGSESDDRGLFGIADSPAGPLRSHAKVKIAGDASPEKLRWIAQWADEHSPVSDAIRRPIPSSIAIEVLG